MKTPTKKIPNWMIPTGQFPPTQLPLRITHTQTIPAQNESNLENSHSG